MKNKRKRKPAFTKFDVLNKSKFLFSRDDVLLFLWDAFFNSLIKKNKARHLKEEKLVYLIISRFFFRKTYNDSTLHNFFSINIITKEYEIIVFIFRILLAVDIRG